MEGMDDSQIMLESCAIFLKAMFGENNWHRWEELKAKAQVENSYSLMTWLLDLGEIELDNNKGLTASNIEQSIKEEHEQPLLSETNCPSGVSSLIPKQIRAHGIISAPPGDLYDKNSQILSEINHPGQSSSSSVETSTLNEVLITPHLDLDRQIQPPNPVEIISIDSSRSHCASCGVSLSDMMVVDGHLKLRHAGSPITITCYCCDNKFQTTSDYVSHHQESQRLNIIGKTKNFVCHLCAKAFSKKLHLEDHIANKHAKLGPRFECPHCSKRFSHARTLGAHVKTCHAG